MEKGMGEPDIEGVAHHGGPVAPSHASAFVRGRRSVGSGTRRLKAARLKAGIESRNQEVRGADVVIRCGRQYRRRRYARADGGPQGTATAPTPISPGSEKLPTPSSLPRAAVSIQAAR